MTSIHLPGCDLGSIVVPSCMGFRKYWFGKALETHLSAGSGKYLQGKLWKRPEHTNHRVTLTYNLFSAPCSGSVQQNSLGSKDSPATQRVLRSCTVRTPSLTPHSFSLAAYLHIGSPMSNPRSPASQGGNPLHAQAAEEQRIHTVSTCVGLSSHVKVLYNSGEAYGEGGQDIIVNNVLNLTHLR
ncbi:hypothetical protein B0H14DRAFT_2593428 [Mycena olivaceomarginata]|nr:hypothetical protein B0H14DRAFT_2593428 [Mycena olivaceomarginata]